MPPAPAPPLRLVIFDATDTPGARARGALREGAAPRSPGLSPAWYAGALLHRITRAADATFGASSWPEALAWAAAAAESRGRSIASLQLRGHGGVTQSGTRALRPGERAGWDAREGVRCDDRGEPLGALWSARGAPSTVTCFTLDLPPGT